MDQALFQPLNMESSSFEPLPHLTERMAEGVMWWVDGRESTAPTFHLGLVPAGTLYSTVDDLARFVEAVLNGGMGPAGRILSSEGLAEMLSPQVKKPTVSCYFDVGFGFNLQTCWEGTLRARHGGGIYGFSTELATLPEEGVGVVVAASRGAAGSVVRHIGEVALRALLAVRKGTPLPEMAPSEVPFAGLRSELDDFAATAAGMSSRAPALYGELLGDYGWAHEGIRILERDGGLYALVERFSLYPLTPVEGDTFKLARMTAYNDELVSFERDEAGRVVALLLGGSVRLPRLE
jgi:CubicO group peptidase (beta-lactamase class C family)